MNTRLRGILFILVSGLLVSINDGIFKSITPYYPPGQILFIVGLGVALVNLMVITFRPDASFQVNNWNWHISRGLMFAIASFAFVASLNYLPLAEVVCIAFAGPLFMTIMAKYYLKENVGIYRLGAVIVGFIGVIVIIQPGSARFEWVMLLPLLVALGDAGRDVLTRKMAPTEDTLSIVFTTFVVLAVAAGLTFFLGWNSIQGEHIIRFAACITITTGSYFCMVEAFRYAPASVIAPFRYVQIIWSILVGYLFWGEVPYYGVYIGILLTIGSGVFIAIREANVRNTVET